MKRIGGVEKAAEKALRWRMEWAPLTVLVVLFALGEALTIIGFATFSPIPIAFGNLLTGFLSWLIVFWILLYLAVEFQLWRKTRNVGHRLQFVGALLVVTAPLYMWIPLLLGGLAAAFSIAGTISLMLFYVSLFMGIVFALYGYYYLGFRAGDIDLYRNVVVREGEKITELTDGYSDRVFTVRYDDLSGANVKSVAKTYATTLGKAGLLLGHELDEKGITLYPVTYTGLGQLRVWTVLVHLYWFAKKPERLTWVRVEWDGRALVHLSPYDYARISRPVAYHSLCVAVADAIVMSLLAFSKSDISASITVLLGESYRPAKRVVRIPSPAAERMGLAVTVLAMLIIIAGMSSALASAVLSPMRQSPAITDIRWVPQNPSSGENVDVYATLSGGNEFFSPVYSFEVIVFAYFNETRVCGVDMRHIEGDSYGARLGSFPEGTELAFFFHADVQRFGIFGSEDFNLFSEPRVLTIGQVQKNGSSDLSVGDVTHEIGPLGSTTFSVEIDSLAQIETAKLLVTRFHTYSSETGSGSGFRAESHNLTKLDDFYQTEVFRLMEPVQGDNFHIIVFYKVVVRDTTWNTGSSELLRLEVIR